MTLRLCCSARARVDCKLCCIARCTALLMLLCVAAAQLLCVFCRSQVVLWRLFAFAAVLMVRRFCTPSVCNRVLQRLKCTAAQQA